MDGGEPRRKNASVGEELHRTTARLGDALLNLTTLLGDVHVQRDDVLARIVGDGREPGGRYGAHGVRRDADDDVRIVRIAGAKRVDVAEDVVQIGIAEASLTGLRVAAWPGAVIGDPEQRDSQPLPLRGVDHRIGEDRAVRVGRAVGLVVDVVELADGAHAGRGELAERDSCDRRDRLRREGGRRAVHLTAPRPKVVARVRTATLRRAAHGALERVAVCGGECRQTNGLCVGSQKAHWRIMRAAARVTK